jgi:hypothetical protein
VSVFVLKDSETLVALQSAEFVREDDFQQLLAKFPSLLSGGQPDDTSPRRWLLLYWPIEQLRAEFEEGCTKNGTDPEEEIRSHLDVEDAEELWQRVKTNLLAGRIRMLFVADQIPAELRRIVEFLNQQMNPAEMLALELRQFVGEGLRTIVPMVYGQTEEAQRKKAVGTPKRQWDEESVLAALENRRGSEALALHRKLRNG